MRLTLCKVLGWWEKGIVSTGTDLDVLGACLSLEEGLLNSWTLSGAERGSTKEMMPEPGLCFFFLRWVFVAVCGLSLVAASRGYSPVAVCRLLIAEVLS